jgi:hypothetical protein
MVDDFFKDYIYIYICICISISTSISIPISISIYIYSIKECYFCCSSVTLIRLLVLAIGEP